MSSITKQRLGKYTYLCESESFWDAEKRRPDNKKVRIGKIDNMTGEPVKTKSIWTDWLLKAFLLKDYRYGTRNRRFAGILQAAAGLRRRKSSPV
jgi:hypothetical protein